MFAPVYHELADQMKAKIRSGDLAGKLPGVRVLGREFAANPATVSKALHILADKGYISIVPGIGAYVTARLRPVRHKTIGIICTGTDETEERRYLSTRRHYSPYTVGQVTGVIDEEAVRQGFHAALIRVSAAQLQQDPAFLTRFPVDGMLFIFSSLNYEISDLLKKKHIPFVSANACYGISEVNYIDFNMTQAVGDLLEGFLARGVTRIGYFGPPGKYGFNERIQSVYRKVLGKRFRSAYFAAEAETFGPAFTQDQDALAEIAWRKMVESGEIPEVILCNADLIDALEKAILKSGRRVSEDVQLAAITIDPGLSGMTRIVGDAPELFRRATRRLVHMIRDEDDSVIQQWLSVQVQWAEESNNVIKMEERCS